MKILLTGVTGYIGKRLLPVLLEQGHQVVCCVRDKNRFTDNFASNENVKVIEVDFLKPETMRQLPKDIEAAYYLIHSMSVNVGDFSDLESQCAHNFVQGIQGTSAKQVIYLSGIINHNELSKHLASRKRVEEQLSEGHFALTTLRAGIIVGSGSASFEIIRDLVEKLPLMVTPKWLNTRTQPIAIRNVIAYLTGVLNKSFTYNQSYDIGGPEVLTYKQMLLQFAEARKLKRYIFTVPLMTPKLSSYWLYFVTSTSYKLAVNLVDSMKVEVIGKPNKLAGQLKIPMLPYGEAVKMAFDKIEQQEVLSSWTDAQTGKIPNPEALLQVPTFGCLNDTRIYPVHNLQHTLKYIFSIGGSNGWYYANFLWKLRGLVDKLLGGVGLRRGRKNQYVINAGESLDFWRVLLASESEKRLLLYAEMKLPGEAWLEFSIKNNHLHQVATFRPKGLLGRLYWYALIPFHHFIFKGMAKHIVS